MQRLFILVLFFSFPFIHKAQDVIYLTDGSKISAKIVEVNPNEIIYKKAGDLTGPIYLISRSNVLIVEYKNGEAEALAKRAANKKIKTANNIDLYYLNKTSFMINGIALTNADLTFLLEHEFANSELSVTLLGGYNFNVNATWPNAILRYYLDNAKKNYDLGLGINYYLTNKRRTQYFIGILLKYMNYSYNKEIITEELVNGATQRRITLEPKQAGQLAPMFVNGFQIRITPNINYKLLLGLGAYSVSSDLRDSYRAKNPLSKSEAPALNIKGYFGICFGYRF